MAIYKGIHAKEKVNSNKPVVPDKAVCRNYRNYLTSKEARGKRVKAITENSIGKAVEKERKNHLSLLLK